MFKNTYLKVKSLAEKPAAKIWLAVISFVESSFFPIPADVMFVPMALSRRQDAFRLAFIATLFSVLGGVFGYFIGKYAYHSLALPMLEMLGKAQKVQYYRDLIQQDIYLLWGLLLSSGLSHIPPIKVVTIISGVAEIALWKFIVSAIVGRGVRFYLLAYCIYHYGEQINDFIEKRFKIITISFCIVIFLGYILYKLIL